MPNKTVWINTQNVERFEQEENKSGLINKLLEAHYDPTKKNGVVEVTHEDHIEDTRVASKKKGCQGHDMKWDCGLPGCRYAN